MNHSDSSPPAQPPAGANHASGQPVQDVDVDKLAEKVYRLLAADLRLEISRAGGNSARR